MSSFRMIHFGGKPKVLTIAQPAVNTELSLTVSDNKRWLVIGLYFSLVTDANAANRNVNVVVKDSSGNILFRSGSNQNHAASTTKNYCFANLGDEGEGLGVFHIMAPAILVIDEGFKIETLTTNIQATDRFSAAYGLALEIDI